MVQQTTQNVITFKGLSGNAAKYRFVSTIDDWQKQAFTENNCPELTRPVIGVPSSELVSRESIGPNLNPKSELRLAAERGLFGLVGFLAISAGLAFVIYFFWAVVMGAANIEVHDLADAIRGYR